MNTSDEERFSMISEEQMEDTILKEEKISYLSESPKCNIVVKHCKNQSLYRQEQFQSCHMARKSDETHSLIDQEELADDQLNFSSSIDFMKKHHRSNIISGGSVLAQFN
jgi:hypothetical protein